LYLQQLQLAIELDELVMAFAVAEGTRPAANRAAAAETMPLLNFTTVLPVR
jgi:hypothetical protein